MSKVRFSFVMEPEQMATLHDLAERRGTSVAEVLRGVLAGATASLPTPMESLWPTHTPVYDKLVAEFSVGKQEFFDPFDRLDELGKDIAEFSAEIDQAMRRRPYGGWVPRRRNWED